MKNDLNYKIFRIIIAILFISLVFIAIWNHLDRILTDEIIDEKIPMLIQCIIAFLFYAIVHYTSIILHEVGHLIFGLKSKLKFMSFNIRGFSIVKKNKKLVIEKSELTKDIGGYCNMQFLDSVKYTNKDVILYFYGGIIINIVLALLFLFIFLLCDNEYIKLLSLLYVIYNFYLAIYNSIPYSNLVGISTDMKHIVNYLHDSEYIEKIGIIDKIMKYRENNKSLKNIDESLLYMPKNFVNDYDMTIALVYIAYLSEKKEYDKMSDSINYVLNNTRNTITEAQKNALKVQKIDCIVHTNFDKIKLKEIWDNSFNKYINQMSLLSIGGFAFKYLYYMVINENQNKAEEIMKEYQNKKRKYPNHQDVKETDEFIRDINNQLNKVSNK